VKKKLFFNKLISISWPLFICFCILSCRSSKQLTYFNNLPDSSVINLPPILKEERSIESGDLLDVNISSSAKEAAEFFNRAKGSGTSSTQDAYVVDPDGFLEFPIIGKVKATGLTVSQLKDGLTKLVTPYLKDPLLNVQFRNFKVTVLGEVRSPGTYELSMQRTTLFEALGSAGDLPYSAKRQGILLYRDYKGQRTITKIDLRNKDVLNDPNIFQIRHNDVLYVQTKRIASSREDMGFFTALFSILITVASLGFAFSR
jgi:polysaccharide export outer membrane protein